MALALFVAGVVAASLGTVGGVPLGLTVGSTATVMIGAWAGRRQVGFLAPCFYLGAQLAVIAAVHPEISPSLIVVFFIGAVLYGAFTLALLLLGVAIDSLRAVDAL
jgi:hypothetical protein